jgi:hypothetical protein
LPYLFQSRDEAATANVSLDFSGNGKKEKSVARTTRRGRASQGVSIAPFDKAEAM